MRHEPPIGAVLGAFVCVEGQQIDILLTIDCLQSEPKWKCPGGGVEPGEHPLLALNREIWEETRFDLGITLRSGLPQFGRNDLKIQEIDRVPVRPGADQLLARHCILLPRSELDPMNFRFIRNKDEHIYCRKFRLRRAVNMAGLLSPQRPFLQTLLQRLDTPVTA